MKVTGPDGENPITDEQCYGHGGRRPGAGRKRGDNPAGRVIGVRVTDDVYARCCDLAEQEGHASLSAFGLAALELALARGSTR